MSALKFETIAIGGAVVIGGLLLWKFKGKVSQQTNASGQPTTAYDNSGAFGTVGAVANTVSGGSLASLGEWLGGIPGDIADWWNPVNPPTAAQKAPPNIAPPSTAAATDKWNQGGNASSGSGGLDIFSDPEGWGAQWGG